MEIRIDKDLLKLSYIMRLLLFRRLSKIIINLWIFIAEHCKDYRPPPLIAIAAALMFEFNCFWQLAISGGVSTYWYTLVALPYREINRNLSK